MTHSMPSYQELEQILSQTELQLSPSEAHGIICGILSGDSRKTIAWEKVVIGEETEEIPEIFQELFDASAEELKEFLFDFQLLLPPDDDSLPLRAEALTLWCQGYLTGLKLVDIQIAGRSPSDVTEAIDDLIEIAKMNYEDVVASEEDEVAYVELVEYVRMAIILIYQDMHETEAVDDESRVSSHHH